MGFIEEVRRAPWFAAAAKPAPKWLGKHKHFEHAMRVAHNTSHEGYRVIFDRMVAVMEDRRLALKERLAKVGAMGDEFQRAS